MRDLILCPACGSHHTEPHLPTADPATIIGGVVAAACVVSRSVPRPIPVLASGLIIGTVIGLLLGARTGRAVGDVRDGAFPRFWKCLGCGKRFEI